MLRFDTSGGAQTILFPAGQTGLDRMRQLVVSLAGLPVASIHDFLDVAVVAAQFQRPLYHRQLVAGTWTQTSPNHSRTDVQFEYREANAPPQWIDLSLRLSTTLVLEVERGEIDSMASEDLGEFSTLGEFEEKFRYFDVSTFMKRHQITTVEQLKQAYRYMLGEIKLKTPIPFDPAAPGNQYRLDMELAILVRENLNLVEALRSARLVSDLAERSIARPPDDEVFALKAPLVPVLVFPEAAIATTGITEAELLAFFAGQDVLAIPLSP